MEKLFALVILFASLSLAQSQLVVKDCGTLAQVTQETHFVNIGDWSRVDSISCSVAATGELDLDSVDVYVGFTGSSGAWYSPTAYTFISTLDLADGVKGYQNLFVSNATLLTSAVMRGAINSLKITVRGAVGTDPTDPNKLLVLFRIWGIPKGGS